MFQVKNISIFFAIFVATSFVRGDSSNDIAAHSKSCQGQTLLTEDFDCTECPDGYICTRTTNNLGASTSTTTFTMSNTTTTTSGISTTTTFLTITKITITINTNSTDESTTSTTATATPTTAFTFSPTNSTDTPSVPSDLDTLCNEIGVTGYYSPDNDTTCTTYVICYRAGTNLHGFLLACPTGMYFESVESICTIIKPVGCI